MTLILPLDMARKQARGNESSFGRRLVALRKARGLTQTQLAEAIDSSQRAISYYENHASYPPAWMIADLSKALGVTADELLGLKKLPRTALPTDDPEVRRLWKKFRQLLSLPERDRRAVSRLVSSLVSAHGGE